MMNCRQVIDLFPVDLGVDLQALQPEITQCKRRFQQELWNVICNRVLQGQSGWKKDSKDSKDSKTKSEDKGDKTEEGGETKEEEAPKEDENRPEESGENENNELFTDEAGNWSNSGQPGRLSRRRGLPPRRYPLPTQPAPRRGSSAMALPRAGPPMTGGRRMPLALPPPRQRPQPQPQQYQQRRQQRMSGDAGGGGSGELSHFLRRIRPQEGVLDWREGGACHRVEPADQPSGASYGRSRATSRGFQMPPTDAGSHRNLQHHQMRSFSATSRREILGCCAAEDDVAAPIEDVEVSEAFEDARVFYGNAAGRDEARGHSDAETATYYMNAATNRGLDGATNSTIASREFVPLVVGNWWGCRGQGQL